MHNKPLEGYSILVTNPHNEVNLDMDVIQSNL